LSDKAIAQLRDRAEGFAPVDHHGKTAFLHGSDFASDGNLIFKRGFQSVFFAHTLGQTGAQEIFAIFYTDHISSNFVAHSFFKDPVFVGKILLGHYRRDFATQIEEHIVGFAADIGDTSSYFIPYMRAR
jgi:hypothetical protein